MAAASPSRIYLDTSAYLAVLLGEKQAQDLQTALRKHTLCSSVLLLIEAERNIVKLVRERIVSNEQYEPLILRLKQDKELFILRDLCAEICLTGTFPAIRLPRSSDLVHLRTALWFSDHGGINGFVTLDKGQGEAARELGFTVLP